MLLPIGYCQARCKLQQVLSGRGCNLGEEGESGEGALVVAAAMDEDSTC
jgi:hypothetical protein